MGIEDLLKATQTKFNKKFKDSETEIKMIKDEEPARGIVIDNPLLEYILDRRFLAYGRCYLAYGKKGSSKTSIFFELAKIVQKAGGHVIWVETENAADKDYAIKMGVNPEALAISHPKSMEEALELILKLVESLKEAYPDGETPVLICLDSFAGCVPDSELEAALTDNTQMCAHAKLAAKFYRRLTDLLAHEKCIFLMLNQLREAVGQMGFSVGGDKPEALIGGEAQRFNSTYQWKMARMADHKGKDEHGMERKIGTRNVLTCVRNKLGREGATQKIWFDMYIEHGVDWWTPLVHQLSEWYPSLIKDCGRKTFTWCEPNIMYKDAVGDEHPIDISAKYSDTELAQLIYASVPAKELIRSYFKIPPLPTDEVVKALETEHKKKRGKKKAEEPQEL